MIDDAPGLEASPDSPKAPVWRPEPELLGPTPRTIRPLLRERLVRWLFVSMCVVMPLLLCYFGYLSQRKLERLADEGVLTTGKVVERHPPKKKSMPRLIYEYQVAGNTYRVSESRNRDFWDATLLGFEAPIRYLPDHPGDAYTEHEFQTSHGLSATALGLWIVSGVLFVVVAPIWLYLEWKHARYRHVLRVGLPTAGIVTAINRFGKSYDHWRVKYVFAPTPETTREGADYLQGVDLQGTLAPGAATTVLVDPQNGNAFELYRAAAKYYRFVADGA